MRLNARLEGDGVETALVTPLDDIRAEIKRAKPDLIVFTGDLADPANVALRARAAVGRHRRSVGLTDGDDPAQRRAPARASASSSVFAKPVDRRRRRRLGSRGILERHALQRGHGADRRERARCAR